MQRCMGETVQRCKGAKVQRCMCWCVGMSTIQLCRLRLWLWYDGSSVVVEGVCNCVCVYILIGGILIMLHLRLISLGGTNDNYKTDITI